MNDILYIFIAVFSAFILAIAFTFTRLYFTILDLQLISSALSWSIIVFGLILSFSILNFYNRYIELRNSFITDLTNLELIYNMFKYCKNSENVLKSIKTYGEYVISIGGRYNQTSKKLYKIMNDDILKYISENPNQFSNNILARLSTNTQNINFVKEIENNTFFINIILMLSIFILISLFLIKIPEPMIQFLADFCFLSIIFVCITLLYILSTPFDSSTLKIKIENYKNLFE